jgi:hypothetical protein
MAADSLGNDISRVFIPVTGFFGYAPKGTDLPSPEDGGDPDFVLPAAFKKAGLLTEDGGFQWTLEPDGDPILFFQEGYQIPSGLANATLVAKLAQTDAIVRQLAWGKVPDANGYITIDAGGHADEYVFFTEEIGKNGDIRRRVAEGTISGVSEDQSTRGEVYGYEVTATMRRSPDLNNEHLGEWIIPAAA